MLKAESRSPKMSGRVDALERDISILFKKPYTCSICQEGFSKTKILKRHVEEKHGQRKHLDMKSGKTSKNQHRQSIGKRRFSCKNCNMKFDEKIRLHMHQKTHSSEEGNNGLKEEKRFPCQKCDKKFTRSAAARRHEEFYHSEVQNYQCEICEEKFKEERVLKAHGKTCPGEKRKTGLNCKFCNAPFRRRIDVNIHEKDHSKTHPLRRKKNIESTSNQIDSEKEQEYQTEEAKQIDQVDHKDESKDKIKEKKNHKVQNHESTNSQMNSDSVLTDINKEMKKQVVQNIKSTNIQMNYENSQENQMKEATNTDKQEHRDESTYVRKKKKQLQNIESTDSKIDFENDQENQMMKAQKVDSRNELQTRKVMSQKMTLRSHKHNKHCGSTFLSELKKQKIVQTSSMGTKEAKSIIETHKKQEDLHSAGNSEKLIQSKLTFKCPKCDKAFGMRFKRDRHIENSHEINEIAFSCAFCCDSFESEIGLVMHNYNAHKDKINSKKLKRNGKDAFQCHRCDKVFGLRTGIKHHLRVAHKVKRAVFHCGSCSLTFQHEVELEMHLEKLHDKMIYEIEVGNVKTSRTINVHRKNAKETKSNRKDADEKGYVLPIVSFIEFQGKEMSTDHKNSPKQVSDDQGEFILGI